MNFISSSLAWLAIGAFASQTSLSGRGIDPEIISAASGGHVKAKNHAINAIPVPFMSREVHQSGFLPPKNIGILKELPIKPKTPTLGDLNLKQRKEFMKHLTNRNFVASLPFDAEAAAAASKASIAQNRRIQNDVKASENKKLEDLKVQHVKKKLRKVVKKHK